MVFLLGWMKLMVRVEVDVEVEIGGLYHHHYRCEGMNERMARWGKGRFFIVVSGLAEVRCAC